MLRCLSWRIQPPDRVERARFWCRAQQELQATLKPVTALFPSATGTFTEGPLAESFRQRLSTAGVGDIVLMERTWLFDPENVKRGNVLFGLGLKLPTGNYRGGNT